MGQGADVLLADVGTAVKQGSRLASEHQRLSRPQAGTPADPFVHEIRRAARGPDGSPPPAHRVGADFLGDRHLANRFVESHHVFAGEQRLDRFGTLGRRLQHHRQLVLGRQVINQHVEQEPVELGFGQRIGSLHLDRILRRQHKERLVQLDNDGPPR